MPKRGEIYKIAGERYQILGGPTELYGRKHYTVKQMDDKVVTDGFGNTRTYEKGKTRLARDDELTLLAGWESIRGDSNVIYQDCPNCDIEQMIFYSGDYICAWCREKLEDV